MSNLSGDSIITPQVVTDKIVLAGSDITKVAGIENDNTVIPHSQAVFIALKEMKIVVDKISQSITAHEDNAVITDSTIDPLFNPKDGWLTNGNCTTFNTIAVFDPTIGSSDDDHFIRLPVKGFPNLGRYILHFKIEKITDCKLNLIDSNERILETFNTPGEYYVEVDVTSSSGVVFKLKLADYTTSSYAKLTYFAIYHIKDKFYRYITNKINEIASIDASGYVTHAKLETMLNGIRQDYIKKLNQVVTAFNNYITNYASHTHTPEQCGAAPVDHTHDLTILGASAIGHTHLPQECGAAPENHTHPDHITNSQFDEALADWIKTKRHLIPTLPAQTIVKAPLTVVPKEYTEVAIDSFGSILLPDVVRNTGESGYDIDFGQVITTSAYTGNLGSLVDTTNNDTVSFAQVPCYIHIVFNTPRTLTGYTITGKDSGSIMTDWEVYQDLALHVHNGTASSDVTTIPITFLEPTVFKILTFKVNAAKVLPFFAKIRLHFADTKPNTITVAPGEIKLAVAQSGGVAVVELDENKRTIVPEIKSDLPLHVFAEFSDNVHVGYYTTYIKPEISKIRRGTDITSNRFSAALELVSGKGYFHPVSGYLSIDKSLDYSEVFDILSTKEEYTTLDTNVIDIIHQPNTKSLLTGYSLEIDKTSPDNIPTWTVEVTEINEADDEIKKVVDTVIVGESIDNRYYIKFDTPVMANKVKLTLRAKNNIKIRKYVPYYSDVWFSITENSTYLADTKKALGYIGTVFNVMDVYTNTKGYTTEVLPIGKSCSLPVNDLAICKKNTKYTVRNPYHTTQVTITPRLAGSITKTQPGLEVISVTEDEIVVQAFTAHSFVLDIVRDW